VCPSPRCIYLCGECWLSYSIWSHTFNWIIMIVFDENSHPICKVLGSCWERKCHWQVQSRYTYIYIYVYTYMYSLTKKIRLKGFGSLDWTLFLSTLSDGDSRLLPWNLFRNFDKFRENLVGRYGDSCENSFEILAVVTILSQISCARGYMCVCVYVCVCVCLHVYLYMIHTHTCKHTQTHI